jgi:UDPglucose--hexose-1-phosphate uridylyltransferase
MTAAESPQRRRNPLTGQWVLVSPQRSHRPWQGQQEPAQPPTAAYDAGCYLCPGNLRITGERNPHYAGTFIFDNDYPALTANSVLPDAAGSPLFEVQPARGASKVICFSPDHGLSLPRMSLPAISGVVEAWCQQSMLLGRDWNWVQVFENKGAMMGCSNPHPHGQIWACSYVPNEPALEDLHQREYFAAHGRSLLLDYAQQELNLRERVVIETEHWLAVVPHWAAWPFEVLLLPKFAVQQLHQLTNTERDDLAIAVKRLTTRYDNLFECSFPYSMGWHGAPFGSPAPSPLPAPHWQLHAHYYPPLLRSASVRKFMVGFELLAEAQRDLTPEQAAERLRAQSDLHYGDP